MEQKKEHQKGRLKEITIQFILVLISSLLLHFVFNSERVEGLPKFSFPQSIALALILRLSFHPVKSK
jgi:hypothetical protein